jgi:hypothetical protein
MKRLFLIFALLFFPLVGTPNAFANEVSITITEPTHRQMNGVFINDDLVTKLSYDGRLGQLVFNPARGIRTWFIDPQLIEEVLQMTTEYKLVDGENGLGVDVATSWLNQLQAITRGDKITALPYGDPSGYWLSKLAPDKKAFYLALGAQRLTAYFGSQISQMANFPDNMNYRLGQSTLKAFKKSQSALQEYSNYMTVEQVNKFQAHSAAILHPALKKNFRAQLKSDLVTNTDLLSNKIRLAPGRFTVTSTKQKLPITLINDFPKPVTVLVKIEAMNGRVWVGSVPEQTVNGKSKVQVMIPVEVITSGDSSLSVSLLSVKSRAFGPTVWYPLNLKVISPIATWVTTGGAIILFLSALIQSFRRIKRKRV